MARTNRPWNLIWVRLQASFGLFLAGLANPSSAARLATVWHAASVESAFRQQVPRLRIAVTLPEIRQANAATIRHQAARQEVHCYLVGRTSRLV
jgi:hypothetical protein